MTYSLSLIQLNLANVYLRFADELYNDREYIPGLKFYHLQTLFHIIVILRFGC